METDLDGEFASDIISDILGITEISNTAGVGIIQYLAFIFQDIALVSKVFGFIHGKQLLSYQL
jgi:hypothetical protein